MRTNLKKSACILIATIAVIASCKKSETSALSTNTTTPATNTDNYSSMSNFFIKNGVAAQTYTITNSVGGTFTTPQGTVVTMPANTFVNSLNQQVTGTVTITFKDIYKKSDMLLSNIPANTISGAPLKSAGEFFIKATSAGTAVNLANTITVKQPLNGLPLDSTMKGWIRTDTGTYDTSGWVLATYSANLATTLSGYVFSLYQFNSPVDSGTWSNSDNSTYFAAYPKTTLTLYETDNSSLYNTYVFLIFKGINSMVHVYYGGTDIFPYFYAPEGLQCTVVAIGVRGGKVYSSFTPITISANQTVNFSMTETTTTAFETALTALN